MKKWLLWMAVVVAWSAPGCVLHHLASDEAALRFARVWETPRLERQTLAVDFVTELPEADERLHDRLGAETLRTLTDSGKFEIAGPNAPPTVRAEITVQVREQTHWVRSVAGGLLLYLIPVRACDHVVEVFVVLRTPDGALIGRQYTQGRGTCTLWLGYALWPAWLGNEATAMVLFRDAMKAATVKMCRALMPEVK
jgi:hypothetical protein